MCLYMCTMIYRYMKTHTKNLPPSLLLFTKPSWDADRPAGSRGVLRTDAEGWRLDQILQAISYRI